MIHEAYSYQVINSPKFYFVYADKILLGCVEKKSGPHQTVSLEIKNHRYRIEEAANGVALITNIITNELIGKITVTSFGLLFSKVVFEYNNVKLKWVSKSIFSLHWQWLKNKETIVDTIEDLEIGQQKGVIVMLDNFAEADLLIMVGVYLRNSMRKTLPSLG